VSVTSTALAKGSAGCKEGGSEFTSASGNTTACNGKEGKEGKEGSPWTAGGVLPEGKSEHGIWAFGETVPQSGHTASVAFTSISFPIPLAAPIVNAEPCDQAGHPACVVHIFSDAETPPTGCKVTSGFLETTANHSLCIMVANEAGATVAVASLAAFNIEGGVAIGAAGRSGVLLDGSSLPAETTGFGTWAVTG
jgi:hypothetical protein